MAYRETEKVKAHKEAQRQLVIASSIDVIKAHGFAGLDTRSIAARAGIARGLIFVYFADKDELVAQVEVVIMNRDAAAIDAAAKQFEGHAVRMLTAGIRALVARFSDRVSREMMAHSAAYRTTLQRKLGHLIGPVLVDKTEGRMLALAALGAVYGLAGTEGAAEKRAQAAVLFVLAGLGISAVTAAKAIEAVEKI